MLFNHIILNSAKNFIEKYQTAGAAAICNGLLAVALYGADQLAPIDNVAFGGFPLLQEFFYIIAASDKSLTHTKVAEDVDQAFTARP